MPGKTRGIQSPLLNRGWSPQGATASPSGRPALRARLSPPPKRHPARAPRAAGRRLGLAAARAGICGPGSGPRAGAGPGHAQSAQVRAAAAAGEGEGAAAAAVRSRAGRSCAVLSQLRQDSGAAVPTSCRQPCAAPPPPARGPLRPLAPGRTSRGPPPTCKAGPQLLVPRRPPESRQRLPCQTPRLEDVAAGHRAPAGKGHRDGGGPVWRRRCPGRRGRGGASAHLEGFARSGRVPRTSKSLVPSAQPSAGHPGGARGAMKLTNASLQAGQLSAWGVCVHVGLRKVGLF